MKKRIRLLCGMILISALFFCACGINTGNSAVDETVESIGQKLSGKEKEVFREDIAGRIGKHIIYSYNVFEGRNLKKGEKEEVIEYLEKADAGLNEDVFITGWTRMSIDGSLRFNGLLSVNGAVVDGVYYTTDVDDPTPNLRIIDPFQTGDIDTSGVLDPKGLCPEIEKLAETHSNDLNDYSTKGVYGSYMLEYDITKNKLVYDFKINDYSHVCVDALTGDILEEYYDDGTIED